MHSFDTAHYLFQGDWLYWEVGLLLEHSSSHLQLQWSPTPGLYRSAEDPTLQSALRIYCQAQPLDCPPSVLSLVCRGWSSWAHHLWHLLVSTSPRSLWCESHSPYPLSQWEPLGLWGAEKLGKVCIHCCMCGGDISPATLISVGPESWLGRCWDRANTLTV